MYPATQPDIPMESNWSTYRAKVAKGKSSFYPKYSMRLMEQGGGRTDRWESEKDGWLFWYD